MYHEEYISRAQDFRAGRLGPVEKYAIERHLETCRDCRELFSRWSLEEPAPGLLAGVMGGLPPVARAQDAWWVRAGWWGTVAASLLVGAAFWHPEKDWIEADRYFASCDRATWECPLGVPTLREVRHE